MGYEVEGTDEFAEWYEALDESEQDQLAGRIDLLAEEGPALKRPVVGEIVGSKHDPRMKELRASAGGSQLRVLFVFDPRRTAILLLGGDKAGQWARWYREAIPQADELYDRYLEELRMEGEL